MSPNVLQLPSDVLIGTYRGGEQKMVDTCIAADALCLAEAGYSTLTIVSNDDDFVPVLLALAQSKGEARWLRRPRTAANDAMLAREGVVLLSDPAWP